ncbi:MAG: sterol desaturase family protein [Bacteroidetes bacterium]|nr:sterol desaturase family protein [Bacteroidota bacterium]
MTIQLSETMRVALLFGALFILCGFEMISPLIKTKRSSIFKTLPNIAMMLLLLLTNFLLAALVALAGMVVERYGIGLFQYFGKVNAVFLTIVGIVLLDFWAAWLPHVLMHKSPFLWRFHAVHHSDVMVDVTTAFRQHPFETVWRVGFQTSGMLLLGLPLEVLVFYLALSAMNAQLEHSNIRLPKRLDRGLQLIFVTPNMHKLHHSKQQLETDSNYSNIFSVWDRLFKTFRRREDYSTIEYGLDYLDKTDFSIKELLVDIPKKH